MQQIVDVCVLAFSSCREKCGNARSTCGCLSQWYHVACPMKLLSYFQYYLVNDTLEIREVHNANDGRDPFPVLINRHKVGKTLGLIIAPGLKSVSRLQHL